MIFATNGGHPENPDWYHNLVANPDVEIEVGAETIAVHATDIEDDAERDALYAPQVERVARFGDYPRKASRRIPVIALDRR